MESSKKSDQELPDGWFLCKSKSIPGRNYYFNKKTGKSSWTQPQDDDESHSKPCKKEKQEKKIKEDSIKKVVKRKSDGLEECTSQKKSKQDTASASMCNYTSTTDILVHNDRKKKMDMSPQCTSTPKRSKSSPSTPTPSKTTPKNVSSQSILSKSVCEKETSTKRASTKNPANTRLSKLRSLLDAEVSKEEELDVSPTKNSKISPKTNESPQKSRSEHRSPLNDSKSIHSPSSDSWQSIPSPSQFFTANKIISSIKAQLPEEFCSKVKQKDTFADIEKGICSQTTEYPFSKHPVTPPQFSEASKILSAIKSKLAYKVTSTKDSTKTYSSAKERMESLRASLSKEREEQGGSLLNTSNEKINIPKKDIEAMDIEDIKEVKTNAPTFTVEKENSKKADDIILVVDTNIFIHDLDCIKNVLNSHIKGYVEQPTLLVPWRVINELDRLKDNNNGNGALCKRAKAAMDYLYKSLPENSRIKGQSLRDANCHIYPCEVPDDEVLNCSLQQVERGRNVILVSNDKNLCNKASINGVKRINVSELKAMVEIKPQPSDPDLVESVKRYQQTIYHLLANILENEMRAKYNNLWQHVLFKAPPWTLADVLQCLLKHWIAVFNEVFPRIEPLIADLKNSLMIIEKKNPNTLTHSEVSNFKELCMEVAKRCQIIPEYMELAKATVERLLRNGSDVEDTDAVVDAFEGLWTVFSSYCAKLSNALGMPHSIEDKLTGSESLTILTTKLTVFTGHITDLTMAIKNVLSTDSTVSIEEQVRRLDRVFRDALAGICMTDNVTREELHSFCIKCRGMLQEAYGKFSQLAELLNVCKNRLTSDIK